MGETTTRRDLVKRGILTTAVLLLIAAAITFAVFEYLAVRDRRTVHDITSEISASLPQGSTANAIEQYLQSSNIAYSRRFVSQTDAETITTYEEVGIMAGTTVIVGKVKQRGTLVWFSPREIQIVFILDRDLTLERIGTAVFEIE